jgi:hypothetical protein
MSRKRARIKVRIHLISSTLLYCQSNRKQRHSITAIALSVNSTINGDSGNVSQDEHEDDQERYHDKIQRLKRTENEVKIILRSKFQHRFVCIFLESSSTIHSSNKKT